MLWKPPALTVKTRRGYYCSDWPQRGSPVQRGVGVDREFEGRGKRWLPGHGTHSPGERCEDQGAKDKFRPCSRGSEARHLPGEVGREPEGKIIQGSFRVDVAAPGAHSDRGVAELKGLPRNQRKRPEARCPAPTPCLWNSSTSLCGEIVPDRGHGHRGPLPGGAQRREDGAAGSGPPGEKTVPNRRRNPVAALAGAPARSVWRPSAFPGGTLSSDGAASHQRVAPTIMAPGPPAPRAARSQPLPRPAAAEAFPGCLHTLRV